MQSATGQAIQSLLWRSQQHSAHGQEGCRERERERERERQIMGKKMSLSRRQGIKFSSINHILLFKLFFFFPPAFGLPLNKDLHVRRRALEKILYTGRPSTFSCAHVYSCNSSLSSYSPRVNSKVCFKACQPCWTSLIRRVFWTGNTFNWLIKVNNSAKNTHESAVEPGRAYCCWRFPSQWGQSRERAVHCIPQCADRCHQHPPHAQVQLANIVIVDTVDDM